MIIRTSLIAISLLVLATSCWADCANPSGIEGKIIYNADAKIPQYCNGTNWVAWGSGWTENWLRSGSDLFYNSGNVGVGTSSPTHNFEVNGTMHSDAQIYATARGSIYSGFWGGGDNRGGLFMPYGYLGSNGAYASSWMWNGYRNSGGTWTSLGVNGLESASGIDLGSWGIYFKAQETTPTGTAISTRMTILNDGNVGIGVTSPQSKLHVAGGVLIHSNLDLKLRSTSTDPGDIVFQGNDGAEYGRVWSSVGNILFSGGALGNQMTYTESGNLYIASGAYKPGGGSWTATSDARLKDVSSGYTNGLAAIAALKPVRFNYKKDNPRNEPSDSEYIGLIAQEAMKVMPELVSLRDDGYYDLDPSALNYALINAVKDLKAANETLLKRVERLENVSKQAQSY